MIRVSSAGLNNLAWALWWHTTMSEAPHTENITRPHIHPLAIVLFLLIVAGVMYSIIRSNGDDRRAPAPTPIYENVNRISP